MPHHIQRAAIADPPPVFSDLANSLLDVAQERQEWLPLSDEYRWATDLCGGFVQGGSYLLGGTPGAFKSGLALQLALDLCRQNIHTLFILTEEPAHRLKDRALRMTSQWPKADVRRALTHLHVEADLQDIETLPRFIATHVLSSTGRYHGVKLIVLDSIQGHGLPVRRRAPTNGCTKRGGCSRPTTSP